MRVSVSRSSSFGVVPDATRAWKPEMAPQAMVMDCLRRGITKVTVTLRNFSRVEAAKARGVYVEPLPPYHTRKREEAAKYMREWRRRKKEGSMVRPPD